MIGRFEEVLRGISFVLKMEEYLKNNSKSHKKNFQTINF